MCQILKVLSKFTFYVQLHPAVTADAWNAIQQVPDKKLPIIKWFVCVFVCVSNDLRLPVRCN